MTFSEIHNAVVARMASWADAPYAWDGQPSSRAVLDAQAAKQPWVRLSINHGTSTTAALGTNPEVRRTGLIFVQVFIAENSGTRPANQIADSLAAHLQYYRDGHFETLAASLTRVGPQDGWYQCNVSLPFRAG